MLHAIVRHDVGVKGSERLADALSGCHVMERESFESPEVAEVLNNNFIPIKIDREERPDIDAIYMNYVQATTGSGGWPLNVFVTPDLEPVFGGTYWLGPNNSMTAVGTAVAETVGFLDILDKMKTVWTQQEDRCRESAKEITRQLRKFAEEGVHSHGQERGGKQDESEALEVELLDEACRHFEARYDKVNGGFSSAPKFPTPVNLSFLLLLSQWPSTVRDIVGHTECTQATTMAITTLRAMARGQHPRPGWLRLLSLLRHSRLVLTALRENALRPSPAPLCLPRRFPYHTRRRNAWLRLRHLLLPHPLLPSLPQVVASTLPKDADSLPSTKDTEKREGAYYVWTHRELLSILGPRDGDIISRFYGVSPDGNVAPQNDPHDEFINQNVLRITTTPSQLAKDLSLPESTIINTLKFSRQKLREHRDTHRPRPALDDKIIVSWNGLAISALARTASVLSSIDPTKSTTCLNAALSAVAFIRRELYSPETKTLYRVYSQSARGSTPGLCDDYAFLIAALLDLYESTFDDLHLQWAEELQQIQLDRFRDPESPSGFYTTPQPTPARTCSCG